MKIKNDPNPLSMVISNGIFHKQIFGLVTIVLHVRNDVNRETVAAQGQALLVRLLVGLRRRMAVACGSRISLRGCGGRFATRPWQI